MKLTTSIIIILLLTISGCGEWPDVVKNKNDIDNLSSNTTTVRTRFLPDSDIKYLARLEQLRQIDFSSGWGTGEAAITDNGVLNLVNLDLKHLQTVSLGHNNNITDKSLKHISTMASVEELMLFDCKNITDAGLLNIKDMPNLRYIDVSGNNGITENGLRPFLSRKDLQIRR